MPAIVIQRERAFQDMIRAYQIFIDGTKKGSIRQNGELRIDVEPGEHTISMKIDWKCAEMKINVGESPIFIKCVANEWLSPMEALRSANYIRIRQIESSSS